MINSSNHLYILLKKFSIFYSLTNKLEVNEWMPFYQSTMIS